MLYALSYRAPGIIDSVGVYLWPVKRANVGRWFMSVRVLLVDDEAVLRELPFLLLSHPRWLVCGESVDVLEAVEKTKSLRPDVVLMDLCAHQFQCPVRRRQVRSQPLFHA